MLSAPLFAFEFGSYAMLGWLAAAAAPVVIHLWSRQRYREVPWAAMEYVLAALRRSRRRIRFEQWLLLLIRTLLVVLVVLAVAEPFLERVGLGSVTGEPTHRVIVIDGSYSMGYRPTDKSRFERAKEAAARIVAESLPGDGFTLVLISAPPRVVVRTPVFEPRDFLQEIDHLKLPHATADLPATLAAVEQVLAGARREYPRLAREEVYFLTDLGRVGWDVSALGGPAQADFHERSRRLAESAALVVIDLGQPAADNLAVTALRAAESLAWVGRDVRVEADLKHFGRQAHQGLLVELLADGRPVKHQRVDLPAGGETSVGFGYRFDTPGDHVLEVRLQGDALDIDDRRWIVLPVKQAISVLCVDGRPAGGGTGGATRYLSLALAPDDHPTGRGPIQPQVVPESALVELPDLGRYECVFLCNVAQFTANEARVLDAYLAQGGSLVFFLGDRVMPDRYHRELADERPDGVRLLPVRLGPLMSQAQDRLDPLGYRHPIVQAFRGRQRAGLLTTPVEKYYKLLVPEKSPAGVALALGNGDPLIAEAPVHRGRVIVVATSADTSWTAMPLWPSFPPLVHEMLGYALGGQIQERNLLVGQSLGGSIPAAAGDVPLSVLCPDGRREPVRPQAEADSSTWTYGDTLTSGVYTAQIGPPPARSELFAVNVDPVESDLAALAPDELRDVVWPDVPFVHRSTWENLERQPLTRSGRRSGLARHLLYAVLALLFAETFLARRFGHHAA